ncbi:30S ribosomal protein S15 [candidate division KSB1 bacterium]
MQTGDIHATMLCMLTKQKKARATKSVQKHETDTGSAAVQVALLSKKIDALTSHLKKNNKDKHSRRGLLQMVADRRKHLKYLEVNNKRSYNAVIKKLGLKK